MAISNRGHIWGSGGFWRFPRHERRRTTGDSLRGDDLEGASRLESRRQAHRLQLLRRAPMASALADDCDWWRPTAAHLRRFRRDRAAMVARRPAHRLHLERGWKHVPLDRRGAGWPPERVETRTRAYRSATGTIRLVVTDAATGREVSARVSVTGGDGRSYAPDDAWRHADDGFDRSERKFEYGYFHTDGELGRHGAGRCV